MFKKITSKIFAIMLLIVVLILSIQVLFQTFFLESFYINKEVDRIENNISELSLKIATTNYENRNSNYVLKEYIGNNNDTIILGNTEAIYNSGIELLASGITDSAFGIIIKSDENQIYNVSLEAFDSESSNYIIEGDNVIIKGKLIGDDANYVVAENVDIFDVDSVVIDNLEADFSVLEGEFKSGIGEKYFEDAQEFEVSGQVVYNYVPNLLEQISYDNENKIYKAVIETYGMDIMNYNMEKAIGIYDVGSSDYNIYEDESGKYILYVEKVAYASGQTRIVYSFTELKQIEGAIGVFNNYMWVTIGVSIFISFIGSLIMSNYLSRPIIEINNVATKISNLDFSEEVKYRSNDEIGNLGNSLNVMANQLESKIDELEGMNDELSTRLEYKIKQENIRKDFVASVSHELKTPITVMKGFIEGIRDGVYQGEKHDQAIDTIYKETKTMEDLTTKMLNLSKLESEESGEIEFKKEMFDIESDILMLLYRYKPLILNKKIKVESNLSESVVLGDNEKIQVVLDNLISNAVKYTPEEGRIRIEILDDYKNYEINIFNECEIPKSFDLEQLWKPFFKADKSGNKSISGTGLGLAIVKKILDLHASNHLIERVDNGINISFTLEKYDDGLV